MEQKSGDDTVQVSPGTAASQNATPHASAGAALEPPVPAFTGIELPAAAWLDGGGTSSSAFTHGLVPARPADRDNRDIYLMLQHIGGRKEGFANPANGLTFTAWQEFSDRLHAAPEVLDGNRASHPQSSLAASPIEHWYWFWQEGICLGYGILRLHPDEDQLRNHGHIAYAIRRDRRGRGDGKVLLGQLCIEARRLGLADPVLVCAESNLTSRRIIETVGGCLVAVREGKCRYRL